MIEFYESDFYELVADDDEEKISLRVTAGRKNAFAIEIFDESRCPVETGICIVFTRAELRDFANQLLGITEGT